VFGVQRGFDRGPFPRQVADMLEPLMPHLRQAYLTQRTLRSVTGLCRTLSETLHLVPNPVLVVDGDGRLQFANRAGEALLARRDGLRAQDGIVTAAHRQQKKQLAACFAAAARGTVGGDALPRGDGNALPRGDIALARLGSAHPLLLRLTLLPRDAGGAGPRIAIFVDPGSVTPTRLQNLNAALKLTPAEARLLDGLSAGQSLAALAEKHGVSVNTLRVQLHRLFEKTGTHRQAELVRFALAADQPAEQTAAES